MLWTEVSNEKIAAMEESAKKYGEQCVKLPKDLKEWQAYKELKTSIENLKQLLPIISILKKDSVKDRHWEALNAKTTHKIPFDQPEIFVIEDLTKAKVLDLLEDIEEIG
jgi:dynein heavy chain